MCWTIENLENTFRVRSTVVLYYECVSLPNSISISQNGSRVNQICADLVLLCDLKKLRYPCNITVLSNFLNASSIDSDKCMKD